MERPTLVEAKQFPDTIFVSAADGNTMHPQDWYYHGEVINPEEIDDSDIVAEYKLVRSGKVKVKQEVTFL